MTFRTAFLPLASLLIVTVLTLSPAPAAAYAVDTVFEDSDENGRLLAVTPLHRLVFVLTRR